MGIINYVHFEFQSLPENVSFARACVGAFASQLNCTLDDIEEVKLVVSEAVSNSIIHGYQNDINQKIANKLTIHQDHDLEMVIKDYGIGIEDIDQAIQANYSSDASRMGLGFTFMQSFTDEMEVLSKPGQGTSVRLKRSFLKETEAFA